MSDPPKVAFKLFGSKKPVVNTTSQNKFESSINNTSQPDQHQVELVTGFDNGEIKSSAPKIEKKELIIPSQPNAHNRYFNLKKANRQQQQLTPQIDQINDEAKRALILEAQEANQVWNERNENSSARIHTIEQRSENTFATTLGTNSSTNTETLEEEKEVDNADYDEVPIEDFGMAVLRGMGYKEDCGLGISNKKKVDVFVPDMRPRGLGLGADRKVLESVNQLKKNLKKDGINEKDDLCMEKGAFVLIEKGPHVDQYGTIECIEEDVSRLTVALAISGANKKKQTISISQYYVKLVTEKEYLKYSKYVNKSKAERVEQETSDKLMNEYHHRDDSKRHRSSKHNNNDGDDSDNDRHRKHRHHDRDRDDKYKSSRRH